jgi:hypothetical protein
MAETQTLNRTEQTSWLVEMPTHVANAIGVEEGSRLILQVRDGNISVEVLPPTPPEIKERAQRIAEKFRDAFAEMKRVGD